MVALDRKMVQAATWFAHGVQRWMGWSSFYLAALCFRAALCGLVVWLLQVHFPAWHLLPFPELVPGVWNLADWLVDRIFTPAMLVFLGVVSQLCVRAHQTLSPTLPAWVARARMRDIRVLRFVVLCTGLTAVAAYLLTWPWTVFGTAFAMLDLWVAVGTYLLAVDPLPPCHGKVREWLRRSLTVPRLVPIKGV